MSTGLGINFANESIVPDGLLDHSQPASPTAYFSDDSLPQGISGSPYGTSNGSEFHRPRTSVEALPSANVLDLKPLPPITNAEKGGLARHATLLSTGATPGRNAQELGTILGDAHSRLKADIAIAAHGRGTSDVNTTSTALEPAKPYARVEVDIRLYNDICIQGGFLQGHIEVAIKEHTDDEPPVLLSGGKVRIIGFESFSNKNDRYIFYQHSALFSDVVLSPRSITYGDEDEEGFSAAIEGHHRLPFSMNVPLSPKYGVPKGILYGRHMVAIRYIVMVSIKVKAGVMGNRSIAYFYRYCEVWPRLNPSIILAPELEPIERSTTKGFFLGGSDKVNLTASVPRLHWIAGQRCYVHIKISNSTKKNIKKITLGLIRSTVVFKPDADLDPLNNRLNIDPDACRTSTYKKQVSESILTAGQRENTGFVSAKGWWMGINAGETLEFSQTILLPPDALSVVRSRFIEIDYHVKVSLNMGTLWTTEISVSLPIRIVSFLSVDPPPSAPFACRPRKQLSSNNTSGHLTTDIASQAHRDVRLGLEYVFSTIPEGRRDQGTLSPLYDGHGDPYAFVRGTTMRDSDWEDYNNRDTPVLEDDNDGIIQQAVTSARIDADYAENAPRFADLYYTSFTENLEDNADYRQTVLPRNANDKDSNLPPRRPNGSRPLRGYSTFAQRVHEKLQTAAIQPKHLRSLSDSCIGDAIPEAAMHIPVEPVLASLLPEGPTQGEDFLDDIPDYYAKADHLIPESFNAASTLSPIPELTASQFSQAEHPISKEIPSLPQLPSPPTAQSLKSLPIPPSVILDDDSMMQRLRRGELHDEQSEYSTSHQISVLSGAGPPLAKEDHTSATSVKDKIRQLEERVKAFES